MANTKGAAMIGIVKMMRRNRERALELLSPDLHRYFEERVVPSSWYPEEHLAELFRAAATLSGVPQERFYESLGAVAAREQFSGTFSDVARTSMLEAKAMVLWSAQHDTGQMKLVSRSEGLTRYELRDFAAPSPEMCGVTTGYLRESYVITGADDVTCSHDRCVCRGDDLCTWVCRWTEKAD